MREKVREKERERERKKRNAKWTTLAILTGSFVRSMIRSSGKRNSRNDNIDFHFLFAVAFKKRRFPRSRLNVWRASITNITINYKASSCILSSVTLCYTQTLERNTTCPQR